MQNAPRKGNTSVRLKRCGLKGIALLYIVLNKNLMNIQPVFIGILHGSAEYITSLSSENLRSI